MQSNSKDSNRRVKIKLDKAHAEIMAACGVSIAEISRSLSRPAVTIRYWLIAAEAEKLKSKAREKRAKNPEHVRQISRRWRANNLDKARENYRNWQARNLQYCRERNKAYQLANGDSIRERHRAYRANNSERLRIIAKAHYERNKQIMAQRHKEWRIKNLDYARSRLREFRRLNLKMARERDRCYNAKRRCAMKRAIVAAKRKDAAQRRELFGNKCAYCGSSNSIVIDHVLPIKLGGLDEAANLIPACFTCNASKGAKLVEKWYKSQLFFSQTKWKKICRHSPQALSAQLSIPVPA
jgi:5-methylcytosine-specific restriction endonuclease McrA